MRRLSYQEFLEEESAVNEAIERANYLAKFCSGLPWQCAALHNLSGLMFGIQNSKSRFIVERDGNWLVFVERNENVFFPFESAWMFGCPLIGTAQEVVELLIEAGREAMNEMIGFVIGGIGEGSDLDNELRKRRNLFDRFDEFSGTDCMTIDCSGGLDEYLSRRSRSFRKSIRQMKEVEDLEIEDASAESPGRVFERIVRIQSLSYKSDSLGGDIFSEPRYQQFYRDLYDRLHAQGHIRTLFARIAGEDAAYIMGGVAGKIYRGFQMTYDEQYRALALGNRLQLENIRRSAEEGIVHYDLGMHSPYKERWADHRERYKCLFVTLSD